MINILEVEKVLLFPPPIAKKKVGLYPAPLMLYQSLNVKGRCAVIVPDGVLFNDAKLHKGTRKHLCNNFNLLKVISLEDGLFLNTGVKSSILFFVNDGETTKVEFCKIKMSDGDIVEESIIKVNVDEIEQNDYTLFVNKYNKVEENKIDGLEYKKLGEICEIKFGTRIKRNDVEVNENSNIKYPCYGGGGVSFYMSEFNRNGLNLVVSRFGVSERCIRIINDNFWLNDSGMTIHTTYNNCMQKYLNYIMYTKQKEIYNLSAGACQKNINIEDFKDLEIPIPSITIQEQIVESLDVIYDTIEGNTKLIENYEKIKKGIIFSCTFNADKQKLGDMYKIKSGKFNSRDANKTGLYPFYNSEASSPIGFIDDYCFDGDNYLILIKDGGSGQGKYGNNIGLGKVFKVSNKTAATSHQLALFPNKEINNNYGYGTIYYRIRHYS